MSVSRSLRGHCKRRFLVRLVAGVLLPLPAAAGSLDRLKNVSDHAKKRAESGPENLLIGLGVFVLLGLAIAFAAWLAVGRKKH